MNQLIGSVLIASILMLAGPATTARPLENPDPAGRQSHGHGHGAIVFISDRDSPSEEDVIDDVYRLFTIEGVGGV